MKDNRGFTLIEIIVTIALLGLISVVLGLNINNMIDKQDEKRMAEYQKKLEDAACVYVEHIGTTTNVNVRYQDLITAGLIKKDLTNPETGKKVEDNGSMVIKVTWLNGEKTCKFNGE